MSFWDWLIVLVPMVFVVSMGYYSRRYVQGVADFLSAGRVARRYIICAADVANALSIIGVVSYIEIHYKTGFALIFWAGLSVPIGIFTGLSGWCAYRFRETKAMSFGQLLEMRYNRPLRIFAALLRSCSEILANMIMPAIAGRFLIYFLDLPRSFQFCGLTFSTFMVVMAICLTIALLLVCWGGTLALIVTDSIQGIIFYPLLVTMVVFILCTFSWSKDIVPTMLDRVQGESFLNPFELKDLRDFNLFHIALGWITMVYCRANWIGGGNSTAAKSPQEQKMAGLIGTFRSALGTVFTLLVAISVIVLLNGSRFSLKADAIRTDISTRVAAEVVSDDALRSEVVAKVKALPPSSHVPGVDAPLSQTQNLDTPYLTTVHETLLQGDDVDDNPEANAVFQQFRSLYHQTMLGVSMRHMLPKGVMGLFLLLMIMAMVSTDDTRLFSSALTISQDVILPFIKKPLTPKQHIWMLRGVSIGVGLLFFIGSTYMSQLDYIAMFVSIMTSLWMGGASPVMIFGLYSRFGTTAGAFTSLLSGLFLGIGGIFVQRNWADVVYPWLVKMHWSDSVGNALELISRPFHPYVVWTMNPVKCPINSYEIHLIIMLITFVLYVTVSKLTCRTPFNLDRMLHRGIYNLDGENKTREPWNLKTVFRKLIGITPEYSKGDRVLAWSFFLYSFFYRFIIAFVLVLLLRPIFGFGNRFWSGYFLVTQVTIPCVIAAICTVWLGTGAVVHLRYLFRDLKKREANDLDNGMVSGHVSLADKKELEAAEQRR